MADIEKQLLLRILDENNINLSDSLQDILNKNHLDFITLKHHIKEEEVNALCEELNLTIVEKAQFRKLMSVIKKVVPENVSSTNLHISDEVHDYIEVPPEIKRIIDTKEFQRLRELKQLGATYWIFPGASHARFEHSLGVYHLARKLMLFLKQNQPQLMITKKEIYAVSTAGLLHDLGHGPFSHVFDHEFVPSMIGAKFRHEDMSIALIKKLFKDNKIDIDDKVLNLICALVSPSTHPHIVAEHKAYNRGWLFEIIANDVNGIDVDKWDYFYRDSHNLNLDISFKFTRLLTHCRVIDDHICFHDKTNYDVQILFNTRYDLFKRVYSHKTSKSIEYMIVDILRLANDTFKITEKIKSAESFMDLTDNLLYLIKHSPIDSPQMRKAKELIDRIYTRDLYKCVSYVLLESKTVQEHEKALRMNEGKENESESSKINYHFIENQWKKEIFEILKRQNDVQEMKMECDDIICQLMSISYGSEKGHPLQDVFFYNNKTPNTAKLIDMDQITTLHDPSKFREIIFRVYVKQKKWKKQVLNATNTFCQNKKMICEKQELSRAGLSPKTIKSPPCVRNAKKSRTKRNLDQAFENSSPPSTPQKKQRLK